MATKAQAKAALEALASGTPNAPQPEADPSGAAVTYIYPDGSARVGTPPFPETSPLQDHAQMVRDALTIIPPIDPTPPDPEAPVDADADNAAVDGDDAKPTRK